VILSKQTESVVNDFQIKLFMGIKVVSAKSGLMKDMVNRAIGK
jgi:hypothetical protein